MAVSVNAQAFNCFRGEDFELILTGDSDAPDPSAFALLATVSRVPGGEVVDSTTTVTTGGSAGAYTLTVEWTRAQTSEWAQQQLVTDVWRTDTGSNVRLAGGTISVLTPVRLPVVV